MLLEFTPGSLLIIDLLNNTLFFKFFDLRIRMPHGAKDFFSVFPEKRRRGPAKFQIV